MRVSILTLGVLVAGLSSQAAAQSPAKPQESLEALTTDANDPTAILAQLKIEEDYTPDEYDTQAEPNTIQIQPVIPIRPFPLMSLQRLIGPTFKVKTIPNGSGVSRGCCRADCSNRVRHSCTPLRIENRSPNSRFNRSSSINWDKGGYVRSREATWTFNLRHNISTEIPKDGVVPPFRIMRKVPKRWMDQAFDQCARN